MTAAILMAPTGNTSSRGPIHNSRARTDSGDRRRNLTLGSTGSGGSTRGADRRELAHRAHTVAREGSRWPHRHLLRGRLDHAPLGCHRSARVPGQLDVELLRLERRQLRMGRGHDAEHPVAAAQRRARQRPPARHRPAGRDQQHREHDIARRRVRRRRSWTRCGRRPRRPRSS